jgi:hypothetical protein
VELFERFERFAKFGKKFKGQESESLKKKLTVEIKSPILSAVKPNIATLRMSASSAYNDFVHARFLLHYSFLSSFSTVSIRLVTTSNNCLG